MADVTLSTPARRTVFAFPGLFGARADLAVSIGGMLAGFGLFLLYISLGWNILTIWFVWVVTLDTPHFFATYSHTYLDAQERQTSRRLLRNSLAVFLVAPTAVLLCYGLYRAGFSNFKLPWRYFIMGVSLWAYSHITRQHYVVLRLYNRKNKETGTDEATLDALVLYGSLALSLVGLLLRHPTTRGWIGLSEWVSFSGVESPLPFDEWVFVIAGAGVVALVAMLAANQVAKLWRGEQVNVPKLVFLGTVIALHGTVSFSGLFSPTSLLPFTAIVTIYHDIQYLFIVWFYGKNRYGRTPKERRKFGLAGQLYTSFPLFYAAALALLSLPLWTLGCLVGRVSVCNVGLALDGDTFMGDTAWIVFFAAFTASAQMHHYLLDQHIWRPAHNARLRQELKLDPAPAG